MKAISFRTRSAIIISSAFIIFLSAFFILSYFAVSDALLVRGDHEVEEQIRRLLTKLRPDVTDTEMRTTILQYGSTGEAVLGIIIRSASNRNVLLTAGPSEALAVLGKVTFPHDQSAKTESENGSYRCFRAANTNFVVDAAMSMQVLRETQSTMVTEFGVLLLFGSILSSGIGYLIAGYTLRPFNRLLEAARKIKASLPPSPERLPYTARTAEMAELSQTINDILDARDENIAKLSSFTADVAHELRTPLTTMKGELEVELRLLPQDDDHREQLQSLLEEAEQLIAIVTDLLLLSEIEQEAHGVISQANTCDLGSSLRNLRDRAQRQAESRGLQFIADISGVEGELRIPAVRFERMVFNVLINAIAFTEQGSVRFTVVQQASGITIEITDTGKGIAQQDLTHLFDRFWRAEHSRNRSYGGAGLGLAITKSIADLYNVEISIRSSIGTGTTVRFDLPPAIIAR